MLNEGSGRATFNYIQSCLYYKTKIFIIGILKSIIRKTGKKWTLLMKIILSLDGIWSDFLFPLRVFFLANSLPLHRRRAQALPVIRGSHVPERSEELP